MAVRVRGFIMLVLGALLLFQAPGPSRSAAAAPGVDPCSLLTKAELEQVLGSLKSGPKPGLAVGTEDRVCEYVGDEGRTASITLHPGEKWEVAKQIFQDRTVVSSIGDEAFAHRNPSGVSLYVRKGVILLQVYVSKRASDLKIAKALAKTALRRL